MGIPSALDPCSLGGKGEASKTNKKSGLALYFFLHHLHVFELCVAISSYYCCKVPS